MKYSFTLIVGIFFIILNHQTISQNSNKTIPYQFVYDDEMVYAKEVAINFIDIVTEDIIKTFNLVENNPFNKLNYPEIDNKAPDEKNKVYQINDIPIESITLPEGNLVLRQKLQNPEQYTELTGSSFYQATVDGDFLVVKYSFYLTSFGMVLGRSDAILIFDSKGNLLHKLNNFDTNVREWALTDNGRYFSYAFGGILDEWSGPFSDAGYKIIDLQKNEIEYEESFSNQISEIRTRSFDNMIKVSYHSINYLYILFDFTKNRKYSRYFTRDEKNLWKRFTKKGLEIYVGDRQSNKYKLLSFDSDFKVEEIK
ncbi:MAG: hypothetical protein B6D61_09050 [Bacteroidetes bacterium 4484_249]|nr:MAG: hypothetical protein B6D61_09050 [Bacteroidetes bacterium 4484_249]